MTISVKGESTRTDSAGRFLLKSPDRHQVMVVDGRSASRVGTVYGTFKIGVNVSAGVTNSLPYTIWMPKLDMAHAVNIPSPTRRDIDHHQSARAGSRTSSTRRNRDSRS